MRIFSFFFVVYFFIFLSPLPAASVELSPEEIDLITKVQKDSLMYFVRMSDKVTGLTRDSSRSGSPASIAATGFSLALLAVGASHNLVDPQLAHDQIKKTLKTLLTKTHHENGFFYHFLDLRSGRRVWASEASSIDTALLIAGALLAAQYYPQTDIERMAHSLYERINWKWMMNQSSLICMGWKPESGFLPYYWDSYNEHLILQALAIGSPTRPIPKEAWQEWHRPEETYNGRTIVYSHSGSLFTYQYAQAFIDFRKLNDRGINYFENSIDASLANREFSLSNRDRYKGYHEKSWGLSASLGPGGYKAYGAKPGEALHDGTITPYAAISSISFTPKESLDAMQFFFHNYKDNLYGAFGFKDAFNLDKNWWAQEYLGIDQGITVLMLENFLHDGTAWERFMALKSVQKWVQLCELDSHSGNPL